MPGSSFRAWLMIAALLAAAATAGYDIYLHQAAPAPAPMVVRAPPSAADLARATEPLRRELEAAKLALAAIAADRDNLKQQLDALQKPALAPAGDKVKAKDKDKDKDKDKAAASVQKQLEAAQRQRDAALSEAAALKRRTQELEAQPRPAPAPSPLAPRRRSPPAARSIRNDRSPNCASFMPAARRRRARHRRPTKPANGSRRRACGWSASPAAACCC